MKARDLIVNASYGPDQLRAIGKAFDDAWEQIDPTVSGRPEAIEAARLKLANAVLSVAKTGVLDTEQLAQAAIKLMLADRTKL